MTYLIHCCVLKQPTTARKIIIKELLRKINFVMLKGEDGISNILEL